MSMDKRDEVRTFEKVNLADVVLGRATLGAGWIWKKCVKPTVKMDICQAPHTGYMISVRMKEVMHDGTEEEYGLGDGASVPPGLWLYRTRGLRKTYLKTRRSSCSAYKGRGQ